MSLHVAKERLAYLDQLIRRKSTGSPEELAFKLDVSVRSVYSYLSFMREQGAPIQFCPRKRSYYYSKHGKFQIGFVEE